jgi:UDP-glucose 4-epimerase
MSTGTSNSIAGRVALVTGGTGFIGRHLCRGLEHSGADVHVVARHAVESPRSHRVDLTDPIATNDLIERLQPAIVFHLASHVTGSRSLAEVLPTFHANLETTVNLLTALSEHRPDRVVLAGSIEEPTTFGESPTSPYAAAKRAQSIYAKLFHRVFGLPVTVARIFMVYGPDQPDEKKLVPYVTRSLLRGDAPRLGSGTRPVDWVYVDDVVAGLIACAAAPDVVGQSVDIGTGTLTPVRSVAEQIGKLVGRGEPVFGAIADRTAEQVRAADPSTLRTLLGRDPVSVDEGLQRTVEWYREHPETIEPTSQR